MKDLPIGLHEGISHDEYHFDPCARPSLSSSIAGIIVEKSPLHAWWAHPRLGGTPGSSSQATERGSILHKLLLGRGQEIVTVAARDWRTDKAKAQREAIRADDKIPVLEDAMKEYERVAGIMRQRIADHGILFKRENTEVTIVWESEGVLCRGRFDHWTPEMFVIDDLKTCETAEPLRVGTSMVTYGADIQRAAYVDALETIFPEAVGRASMRFIYAEVEAPWDVVVVDPPGTMRELGERKWKRAKERWGKCLAAGTSEEHWPGYSRVPIRPEAPAWAIAKDMESELNNMEASNGSVPF
jgi:hypothetical protein